MKMTLAEKMEKWKETQTLANELAEQVKAEVMQLGKTQSARGVVATFSNGRGSYEYKTAVQRAGLTIGQLQEFEKVTHDFKAACEAHDIDVSEFYTSGTPSVTLKIAEGK